MVSNDRGTLRNPKTVENDAPYITVFVTNKNEGLDLKGVKHVHLLTPQTVPQEQQTIGRAIRFCSFLGIPKGEWRVRVWEYFAGNPTTVKGLSSVKRCLECAKIVDAHLRASPSLPRITSICDERSLQAAKIVLDREGDRIPHDVRACLRLLIDEKACALSEYCSSTGKLAGLEVHLRRLSLMKTRLSKNLTEIVAALKGVPRKGNPRLRNLKKRVLVEKRKVTSELKKTQEKYKKTALKQQMTKQVTKCAISPSTEEMGLGKPTPFNPTKWSEREAIKEFKSHTGRFPIGEISPKADTGRFPVFPKADTPVGEVSPTPAAETGVPRIPPAPVRHDDPEDFKWEDFFLIGRTDQVLKALPSGGGGEVDFPALDLERRVPHEKAALDLERSVPHEKAALIITQEKKKARNPKKKINCETKVVLMQKKEKKGESFFTKSGKPSSSKKKMKELVEGGFPVMVDDLMKKFAVAKYETFRKFLLALAEVAADCKLFKNLHEERYPTLQCGAGRRRNITPSSRGRVSRQFRLASYREPRRVLSGSRRPDFV